MTCRIITVQSQLIGTCVVTNTTYMYMVTWHDLSLFGVLCVVVLTNCCWHCCVAVIGDQGVMRTPQALLSSPCIFYFCQWIRSEQDSTGTPGSLLAGWLLAFFAFLHSMRSDQGVNKESTRIPGPLLVFYANFPGVYRESWGVLRSPGVHKESTRTRGGV